MKVTIYSGTVFNQSIYPLVDTSYQLADHNFTINGQRVLDVAGFARATHVQVFSRKNRRTAISFDVARLHESLFDAGLFIMDHAEEVPDFGVIEIVIEDGSGQTAKRWLNGAGIESIALTENAGLTTRWRYSIVGGRMLKTKP